MASLKELDVGEQACCTDKQESLPTTSVGSIVFRESNQSGAATSRKQREGRQGGTYLVELGSRDAGGNEVDVGAGAHVKDELLPIAQLNQEAGGHLLHQHKRIGHEH